MPKPDAVAQDHADSRLVLVNAVALAAADAWSQVDPDNVVDSWTLQVPELLAVTSGAQLAAAADADPYLEELAAGETGPAEEAPRIDPRGFVGGSSGMQLAMMLVQPAFSVLMAIAARSRVDDALRIGRHQLDTTVRTQVADAGRVADGVALAARRGLDGYARVVVGKTCSRCLLLAGKRYKWNDGFRRHPRCDCVHVPVKLAEHLQVVQDPAAIYRSMTEQERQRAGWSLTDQRAIADGADLAQVTNAHRGVYTAGGQAYAREGTTRRGLAGSRLGAGRGQRAVRLTPEQIYRDAGDDRGEALQLLYRHGYLVDDPALVPRSRLGLAARQASGVSPAKAVSAAGPPIRRTLAMQHTTEEIGRAFEFEAERITGRTIRADFEGSSPTTAREHAEGVLRGLEHFPEAKLRRVVTFEEDVATYAEAGNGDIAFNLRFSSTAGRPRYIRSLHGDSVGWDDADPLSVGWGVRGGGSPAGVGVHEFAHILDIDNLGESIHPAVNDLVASLAAREGIAADKLIARQISQYATTNGHELIAEAFTDVLINGDRASELSRGIFDLLQTEYSRGGSAIRTPAMATAQRAAREIGLAGKTVPELRALARERGVRIPSGSRKADIVRLLEETEGPAAPAAAVAPTKRALARARQVEIDRRGAVADLLEEFDELIGKQADRSVFTQRLDHAAATGVDTKAVDALRRALATDDRTKLRAAITRLGTSNGLKPVARASQKVRFDEALHEHLGEAPAAGTQVVVVRRGTTLTLDGETIQLSKAKVTGIPTKATKATKAPKPAKAATAPGPALPNRKARRLDDVMADLRDAYRVRLETGGRKAAEKLRADAQRDLELAIHGRYGGLDVELDDLGSPRADSVTINGRILRNGRKVGQFTRMFLREPDGTLIAHHSFLELDKAVQGSGFAREFNQNLYDWYRRSGFDHVGVHANIDVGGYTWATQGFDFRDRKAAEAWFTDSRLRLGRMQSSTANSAISMSRVFPSLSAKQIAAEIKSFEDLLAAAVAGRHVSAYEFSQLGRQPGQGRDDMWIGKFMMLNSHWMGTKPL